MGMRWTTIPRWLYENDLPDHEMQEVYVRVLRKKVGELLAERQRQPLRSERWWHLDGMLGRAESVLEDAEAALARYRRRRRGP